MSEELFFNLVKDWEKKKIRDESRSVLINDYLKNTGLTIHALAKKMNVSYSLLRSWMSKEVTSPAEIIYKSQYNSVYTLADRLAFLLSKNPRISDKDRVKLDAVIKEYEHWKAKNNDK